MWSEGKTLLVTGSTGFLGRLIVCRLLQDRAARVVLPVRAGTATESLTAAIRKELATTGATDADTLLTRLDVLPFPDPVSASEILAACSGRKISEIIHSAGCIDYFNKTKLIEGNIQLTETWLEAARQMALDRFVFVSTAFSCGFTEGLIREQPHAEPAEDPTDYTWSKREAERIVAASGLSFLILRPSVVIGHSTSGLYEGKTYGLYQMWKAAERLLCRKYIPEMHVVAPRIPLQSIHQDAFQDGVMTALEQSPRDSYVHLISRKSTLPTVRDLWTMWAHGISRPERIHYYDRLQDVPLEQLDRPMRTWSEFVATNTEIASYDWNFDRATLNHWESRGLMNAVHVTVETLHVAQQRLVRESSRIQNFLTVCKEQLSGQTAIFDHSLPQTAKTTG